ncbi:cytochrome P450 [Frankia sp. B2]|uniref:Cytochrome P450 n=2 Tax=Frankia TaxID=1854 RepID=Q2J9L6_FRACC|nr:cytochrome P450 [Frankia casuarinae]ETA01830.1 cytochrome P450 [Frankia sp. CcI6]KDA43078.1 cytochrome P450 [Frankia sp. BMG5.23]OHV53815.1 cytochrome P450 [Frankia sp. CgIS1]TFE29734.1 cytochrome P450 [Frankia sp. B2]
MAVRGSRGPVPGDGGPPLVGYTLRYLHDPAQHWRQRYDRYGPVSWERTFGLRVVSLLGPDATGLALRNHEQAFANGPGQQRIAGPFFRRGLSMLDFDEHRHHRRILAGAFAPDRLRGYLAGMNPSIERGVAGWRPGARFQVYPAVKQLTLELATRIFMGERLGPEADRFNAALFACIRAPGAVVRVPAPGLRWSRGLAGRRYLEEFLRLRVPAKRAGSGTDMFSRLCHAEAEDGSRLSDDDVVNHMILMMVAAHDTSTITMTSMSYYLARHPEWQQRCREESLALGTPAVDHADLDRLPSLALVMKEALRLVTPVPILLRATVKDIDVLGVTVPAGTVAALALAFTHQMPEYWPSPERFDPERFADHRREDKVHPYAWQPFGGGPHTCIGLHFAGQQVKAILHQMLLRYRWSLAPGYRISLDRFPLPVPRDGLPVQLEKIT